MPLSLPTFMPHVGVWWWFSKCVSPAAAASGHVLEMQIHLPHPMPFESAIQDGSQYSVFIYIILFIIYLAVLDLHCCESLSLVVTSEGLTLVAIWGLFVAVASLVVEHRLWVSWSQ